MRLTNSTLLLTAAMAVAITGCEPQEEGEFQQPKGGQVADTATPHEHGPHGGHVAHLDEHNARVEFTFDPETRDITVYFLKHDNNEPAEIDPEKVTFTLEYNEQTADFLMDAQGETPAERKYVVAGSKVPEGIEDLEQVHGHVTVVVDGEEAVAEFDEEGHDEHEHGDDHGHGEKDHKHDDHDKKK